MSDINGLLAPDDGAGAVERKRLDATLEQLGRHIDEERDPPYVSDPDVFDGMSREEMLGKVSSLDAGQIEDLAGRVLSVAREFDIGWGLFSLKNIISSGWEGNAADAAAAAVDRLMDPVGDTNASLQTIGVKLRQAGSAASDVKPPVQSLLSDALPLQLLISGADAVAAKAEQENQRREAAQILERIYKPSFIDAGTNVPSIVPPPPIAGVQGDGGGGWSGTDGTTGVGAEGSGPLGEGESAAAEEDGAANTQAAAAEGSPQGAAPGSQGGANSPTSTTSANAHSPQSGANANGGSTGGIGGVGGSAPRRGNDRANESQGGALVPGAIPPGMAAGAAAGAAAGTGAGAVSAKPSMARPGMGMAMPMGAPGAGAGKNEDTEHETPSYLINMDNGNELIGDIGAVAPPVIGA
ncbi:hypothetical protein BFN03_02205 [Rhodococcus sp. WMMA185]|uniref:hypothetical protein n=1 Tax=Rhodococcus sp. WMMA185 TaxID=679318 RepID=UPI00087863B9|nr:hypothetical protein [Rhodococcus sp. WMMA185]AOW91907.1 hypothetical protein BFN03_02205 [Rhodococcus sp. WMMA185]